MNFRVDVYFYAHDFGAHESKRVIVLNAKDGFDARDKAIVEVKRLYPVHEVTETHTADLGEVTVVGR